MYLRVRPGLLKREPAREGAAVTYLIVGLDRSTFAPWHQNVLAGDIGRAKQIARARAAAQGVHLVIAAVIGPNSCVLADPADRAASVEAA
jgi:hypothetical protein